MPNPDSDIPGNGDRDTAGNGHHGHVVEWNVTGARGHTVTDFNEGTIEEFRANDGKLGGMFEGAPILILHTTGAKSGKARENPVMFRKEGDRLFVFASKDGAHTHPDWLHNIRANTTVKVEAPGETYEATATELTEPERQDVYDRQGSDWPQFAAYAEGTTRVIPVIELVRV